MTGPLRALWDAWKAEEASRGTQWDDSGHVVSLEPGTQMVRSSRADSVPASAIAYMVAHGAEAGLLVAGDPGSASTIAAQEVERVQAAQRAADEAAKAAAAAAAGANGGSTSGGGAGDPGSASNPRPEGDGTGTGTGTGTDGQGTPGTGSGSGDPQGDAPPPSGGGENVPDLTNPDGTTPPPTTPPASDPAASLGDRADLKYGTDHARQVLDLYLPSTPPAGPIPVIVFFHGGGFYRGDKKDVKTFFPVLEKGYALASANYYLLAGDALGGSNPIEKVAEIAKAAYDARKAVRWLKDNAGKWNLDAAKFAAVGASAGGYLSATVGSTGNVGKLGSEGGGSGTSPAVQAVVDWAGPTNFATFTQHRGGGGFPPDLASQFLQSQGAISPFDYVDGGDPPHLIRHGQQDPVVPYQQSTTYGDKLKGAGVTVDIKIYPDLAHEPDEKFMADEVAATITFLDTYLK